MPWSMFITSKIIRKCFLLLTFCCQQRYTWIPSYYGRAYIFIYALLFEAEKACKVIDTVWEESKRDKPFGKGGSDRYNWYPKS